MLIKMEQLWSDLETLGEVKSKSAKRAALLEAIREPYPHLFAQLAIQANLDYELLKRSIISAASFEKFESHEKQSSLAMHADGRKPKHTAYSAPRQQQQRNSSTKLQADQCAFCLKNNHRWRECRHYLNGGKPAARPPSMAQPNFPPPPNQAARKPANSNSNRHGNSGGRSFLALNPCADKSTRDSATSVITNNSTWVIDSGANMHMTPDSSCMINCRATTSSCTFGDGQKVHAQQVGDVVLDVDSSHGCEGLPVTGYSSILEGT
jgi:hypothetical protein